MPASSPQAIKAEGANYEVDAGRKRQLKKRVEEGLQFMVKNANESLSSELRKAFVSSEDRLLLEDKHKQAINAIKELANEQYELELNQERHQLHLSAGPPVHPDWTHAIHEQNRNISNIIPTGHAVKTIAIRRRPILHVQPPSSYITPLKAVPEVWKPDIPGEESKSYTNFGRRGSTASMRSTGSGGRTPDRVDNDREHVRNRPYESGDRDRDKDKDMDQRQKDKDRDVDSEPRYPGHYSYSRPAGYPTTKDADGDLSPSRRYDYRRGLDDREYSLSESARPIPTRQPSYLRRDEPRRGIGDKDPHSRPYPPRRYPAGDRPMLHQSSTSEDSSLSHRRESSDPSDDHLWRPISVPLHGDESQEVEPQDEDVSSSGDQSEEDDEMDAEAKQLEDERREADEKIKETTVEIQRLVEEEKRLEEESKRKEEEAKLKEEQVKKKMEEVKRVEDEAKRFEEELKRREGVVTRKAEEVGRKEEEAKQKEEEARTREEETKRKAEEARRLELEAVRQVEEAKKQEAEAKKKEAGRKRKEERLRNDMEKTRSMREEASRIVEEVRQKQETLRKLEEETEKKGQEILERERVLHLHEQELRKIEEIRLNQEKLEEEIKKKEQELQERERALYLREIELRTTEEARLNQEREFEEEKKKRWSERDEARLKQETLQKLEERRRKNKEIQEREQALRLREQELRTREEASWRKAENSKRIEVEIKRKEWEAGKRDAVVKRKDAELKRKEQVRQNDESARQDPNAKAPSEDYNIRRRAYREQQREQTFDPDELFELDFNPIGGRTQSRKQEQGEKGRRVGEQKRQDGVEGILNAPHASPTGVSTSKSPTKTMFSWPDSDRVSVNSTWTSSSAWSSSTATTSLPSQATTRTSTQAVPSSSDRRLGWLGT